MALVDVFLALTACISLWTTAEEIAIGCVTEFIYGASSPILTRIKNTVSFFDCGTCAVFTLPPLITDFGPGLLVTRVVALTVHRGDTKYRALIPVIVGLTLYPH